MWTGDTTPDYTNFRTLYLPLGFVDVCYTLAEVELGILLCCDTLDLDERGVGASVALGTLVAEDASLGVESC